MRVLLQLHTAIVGRTPSQGPCRAFGGLLAQRNRHFVRGNAGGSDNKKYTADLELDANFEPTTYPDGCDKDNYLSYFKRSKVYVMGDPLKDRYAVNSR
ncbi:hypothetical protein AAVH_09989 [Aphelenchoides avenae]|nr:hypothetical protein AAVH_09989 [Aphelenchus avenae]